MSQGFNQRDFRNIIKAFDSGVPEEKYLIHKYNGNAMTEAAIKRNSRNAYVGEPIKLTFYMKNPLRESISASDIRIRLKAGLENFKIIASDTSVTVQKFKSQQVAMTIIPNSAGFLELEKIEWVFMKLVNSYRIKEPQEARSD